MRTSKIILDVLDKRLRVLLLCQRRQGEMEKRKQGIQNASHNLQRLLILASDFKSGQFCDEVLACSGTFCRFRQFPMVPARYNTPIPSETADETRA
jgi:hypothetical protein